MDTPLMEKKKGFPPALGFVSIHPRFVKSYLEFGVFSAAARKRGIEFLVEDLRSYSRDKHGTVDDAPYGGGDGMVMLAPVLGDCVSAIKSQWQSRFGTPEVIMPCPKGKVFTQDVAQELACLQKPLLFVCGRFGGMDQRFIDQHVTRRVSIGDFILSGGELPAMTVADSVLRMIPGVLGNAKSAQEDSFSGDLRGLLEHPLYTRPPEYDGSLVPDELLSGNHQRIAEWKKEMSLRETRKFRPDLLSPEEEDE